MSTPQHVDSQPSRTPTLDDPPAGEQRHSRSASLVSNPGGDDFESADGNSGVFGRRDGPPLTFPQEQGKLPNLPETQGGSSLRGAPNFSYVY